jgi:hypothetical protein
MRIRLPGCVSVCMYWEKGRGTSIGALPSAFKGFPDISPEWNRPSGTQGLGPLVTVWVPLPRKKNATLGDG